MKIIISGDHAGYEMKSYLKQVLEKHGHDVVDLGPMNNESVDYPDYSHPLAKKVEQGDANFGILICGSGNGVAMAANKHSGIRAAICWKEELAALARKHNDANILALPARFISNEEAEAITLTFLATAFEGGRHERRVKKIPC